MLVVICVFFLLLGIGMLVWGYLTAPVDYSGNRDLCTDSVVARFIIGGIAFLASLGLFIAVMVLMPKIATESTYDRRIEVVQESNVQLEEQICAAVERYIEHEDNVYEKLDVTTAIGLFSAYPNLKSNELVQSLIETYRANTEEIKKLKLEKTDLAVYKFLVYFGH